jgi:ribosomal protein L11 methyltransferase
VTSLWRVSVRVPTDHAEEMRATFVALAPEGFEERDVGWATELAVYVDTAALDGLRGRLSDPTFERVEDRWEDAWRAFHRPVEVAGVWLGPPWETPPDPARAVVIDPGRAFGTGAHPTTRLCVELLAGVDGRGSLLDVGCGSGVLSIAARKLGFEPVIALDHDPVTLEAAAENARANNVTVDLRLGEALESPLPRADIAVANISATAIETLAARLEAPHLLTSGYLATDGPEAAHYRHAEHRELDGWAADSWSRA